MVISSKQIPLLMRRVLPLVTAWSGEAVTTTRALESDFGLESGALSALIEKWLNDSDFEAAVAECYTPVDREEPPYNYTVNEKGLSLLLLFIGEPGLEPKSKLAPVYATAYTQAFEHMKKLIAAEQETKGNDE